jgi:hypothetical protein
MMFGFCFSFTVACGEKNKESAKIRTGRVHGNAPEMAWIKMFANIFQEAFFQIKQGFQNTIIIDIKLNF